MAVDTYSLVILGQTANEFWENVMSFSSNVTSSDDPVKDADDLITGFRDNIEEAMISTLATDASIHGYKCKRINNTGGPYVMNPITPVVGTVTGTSATSATAQLLKAPFTRSGKWYNGKIFLASVPESALTGNTLSGGQLTLLQAFIDALTTQFTNGGKDYTFTIWSKKVSLPFVPFDVEVSTKIGVQRRRLLPIL